MMPVGPATERLVLDQPGEGDVDDITRYCRERVFALYLTTPFPYRRSDGERFVREYVPTGWDTDREYTWALRRGAGEPLLGVIGWRAARSDVGFWLGGPHRGQGLMSEALGAVVNWLLARDVPVIRWEAVVGNVASAATARAAGFRYTGEAPAEVVARDGSRPAAWHGELASIAPRRRQPGWPIP